MFFLNKKPAVAGETETSAEPEGMLLAYNTDDLMTRAEKIVYAVGYRGAVGNYVIAVYRVLQAYEKVDSQVAANPSPGSDDA